MRMPILASCLCLTLLAGCGVTRPARYYILTPVEAGGTQTVTGPALGIGPVTLPAYLDRQEIAHRSGDNQLQFADGDRWAEPLKTAFSRTLAENLSVMLPTDRIDLYPWGRTTRIDYQITVDVTRFDVDASGMVVLVAAWNIISRGDPAAASRHRRIYTEAVADMTYPAIVAAQSRSLAQLSRDIVASINTGQPPAGHDMAD